MLNNVPWKLSRGKRHLSWITRDIKRQMRKRDKLHSKAKRNPSSNSWSVYRQYRNRVTSVVRKAHQDYVNNIIGTSLTEKPKCFWSYVKLMRTENLGIPTLRTATKLCTTDLDKAEALNAHFKSVFTQEQDSDIPDKGTFVYPSISNLTIGTEGVAKQLALLNPAKACGPDELPPRLLKTVAFEIAPALTFLFNQSYVTGTVPTEWKKALVTGIYKKGPKSDPANYRPISLTCLCCKVMEHIVLSHVAKHLSSNNILIDSQHGFREKLSTVTQLITSCHDWATTLQKRGQADVVLLDFSKAFDKVPHQRLSAKLSFYGIQGPTLEWINSFLCSRVQAVSVNGAVSSWESVSSGVPQGSVLGPALFLLYINDIQENIQSSMRLFADDSIVYREIESQEDHIILQKDLETLADWSSKWLMHFNVKKCAILSITKKRNPSIHQYNIFGETLDRVDQHDYLGVTISHDLRWDDHCNKITQKANRTLGLLRRTLSPCSRDVKEKAYQAIRPQLEYASEAWNPYSINTVNRVEQVQRAAARFVFRDFRRTTSVSSLINTLGWDQLHIRRLASQLTMFYKIHHGLVNIQLPHTIVPAPFIGRHDHQFKFTAPEATIDPYKYSFYPRSIRLWNQLPSTAVLAPSAAIFQEVSLPVIRGMRLPVGSRLL